MTQHHLRDIANLSQHTVVGSYRWWSRGIPIRPCVAARIVGLQGRLRTLLEPPQSSTAWPSAGMRHRPDVRNSGRAWSPMLILAPERPSRGLR